MDEGGKSLVSDADRRSSMRHATLSACWGAVSAVIIRDSSVIILFAAALGAGDMLSLVTTSFMSIAEFLLLLPMAYFAEYVGKKRLSSISTWLCMLMMLLCAAAPWFGAYSKFVLLLSVAFYGIFQCGYVAVWYPLLDGVVPEEERGRFFGTMRTSWQICSALFILGAGCMIGKNPPIHSLQIVIAITGVALFGRIWHMNRMTEVKWPKPPQVRLVAMDLLGNTQLVGFSIYLFCLYAAASSTVPVVFLMAKNHLHVQDNIVVIISALMLFGTIAGFFAGGYLVDWLGVKTIFLSAHFSFGIINLLLLGIVTGSALSVSAMCLLVIAYGFVTSCASIAVSTEMLALAPKNNKLMSIAFTLTMFGAGNGFSRLASSLLLGSGILAGSWSLFGLRMSHYHSIFLLSGISVILACVLLVLVPALLKGMVQRLPE